MCNLLFRYFYLFFSFCSGCVLFSKIESFGLVLSFDFFCFVRLWLDLKVVFKRIIHPVLIWFGYREFFFFSQAISLWFETLVTTLVIVVYYIIPSDRVKGKFETCENWLDLLSVKAKT